MTTTRSVNLSIFCLSLLLAAVGAAGQECKSVHVANVKSIFAMATSPTGSNLLFYGSAEKAEGEIVTGNLFRLRLDATSGVEQLKSPDASNPPGPVWQPDGSSAYFETDEGIYQLSSARDTPELVWKGPADGLAISPDGLLLAFWRIGKGTDTLVLFDLKKKSEARTWRVPDRFESDKSGWDIAFAHDGRALYARTYDQTSNTPLKRFDVGSGNVTVVSPNSYAAAEGKEAVYFIGVSGDARSLYKITAGVRSTLVAKEFGYDSLASSGNPRWLVSQDYRTKQMVVLDTQTDAIKPIGKHEAAAVLSDGRLLSAKGAEITVGDSSCTADMHSETVDPKTGNLYLTNSAVAFSKAKQ
jgi:hypothetical protein